MGRSPNYQNDYLDWLDRQAGLIQRCPTYRLSRSSRAPEFAALTSYIATKDVKIEITGDGQKANMTRGQATVTGDIESILRHIENAKDENRPKSFTKSNLIQLTQNIAEYRSALINQSPESENQNQETQK